MKKLFLALFAISVSLTSCKHEKSDLADGLYAEITTNKGKILCELEYQKAPVTVANFVTLAEGKNAFCSDEFKGKPFYDGLKFHRVVPSFMIQGGDPLSDGSGGPGYKFSDEFNADLKHDRAGTLSMANAGPGTNGSQFFITHLPTPQLDQRHSVFGYVVTGQDVVDAIGQNDVMESVKIVRVGEAAKRFDASKTFRDYFSKELDNQKKQAEVAAEYQKIYTEKYKAVIDKKVAELTALRAKATKLPSGVEFLITKKGSGEKPANGTLTFMNYAGYLENGLLFDSNIISVAEAYGKYEQAREQGGGYLPMRFVYGPQGQLIPGFKEGMSQLSYGDKAVLFIPSTMGYGAAGAGGIIPPNANLVFEVELIKNEDQPSTRK
ncbi:peptidylprolyl isomerase [Flavobacterium sp. MAH-1]|uniref:peptidylprolyl isomerase n=1 Tax=Flavobacterium agri TaxID=2743471 RepID=A0A7Y8Y4I0_9FLAO|nr:peptidylprolyl isomerase [Flavobacterium agri]NUY82440.1 peptidylprolyl isomerase [Flavobacterium agri]NYA72464.1 peptidylprolyl isomerase [Flavobacterium agri]